MAKVKLHPRYKKIGLPNKKGKIELLDSNVIYDSENYIGADEYFVPAGFVAPVEEVKEIVEEVEKSPGEMTPSELEEKFSRDELVAQASALEINVDSKANKATIANAIYKALNE